MQPFLQQAKMHILIVEDDIKLAAFMKKGFESAGFKVAHCPEGESGLRMALQGAYDAAVIDIMLPGRDGLSLIEELRQRQKPPTPVIILSARLSLDDRILGLQKGGDDYLVKPFAFTELLARV
jgi:two-component system OmpR family response regulator